MHVLEGVRIADGKVSAAAHADSAAQAEPATTADTAHTATAMAPGSVWMSSELTATGLEQSIAHDLGVVPSRVIVHILAGNGPSGTLMPRVTKVTVGGVGRVLAGANFELEAHK